MATAHLTNLTEGAAAIAVERQRQVAAEGWTPEHDDEHAEGELLAAASCYLQAAQVAERADEALQAVMRYLDRSGIEPDEDVARQRENPARHFFGWDGAPELWPWDVRWWKPSPDPERNLVKAGALIAAELDRLARAS